jgi:hypothetical protein
MKTERVANLLNDWLSSNRYQQTALAREAELTQLSFLRNGIRGMTRALREEDRFVLIKQWVRDVLPDSYRDRVSLRLDRKAEEATETFVGYPSLEDAFAILRKNAPGNRELTKVLVNLASLLREGSLRK